MFGFGHWLGWAAACGAAITPADAGIMQGTPSTAASAVSDFLTFFTPLLTPVAITRHPVSTVPTRT